MAQLASMAPIEGDAQRLLMRGQIGDAGQEGQSRLKGAGQISAAMIVEKKLSVIEYCWA